MRPYLLLSFLALAACTGTVGDADSGKSDVDAGTLDAGTPDAGSIDAGDVDAGTADSGTPDAGTLDAGLALYSTHLMIAFVGHSADLRAWVRELKAAGYNHIWAHMDDYTEAYYPRDLRRLMDEAADAGLQVSPGAAGGMDAGSVAQVVLDTFTHPAIFKIDGKPVYLDYGHNRSQFDQTVAQLAQQGRARSSYFLLSNTLYPQQNGATWTEYATGTPADVAAVNHAFDIDPNIDGFVNFAVDKGTSNAATAIAKIINENTVTTQAAHARGKLTMAGTNAFYASVQITDFGFEGSAQVWQAILDQDPRPEFVNDVTANDYAELSYMAPLENAPVDGVAYVPLASAGYFLGKAVRTPLLDHSGVQRFLRPWADAYLSGARQPTFTRDRMFAWYSLHPLNAPSIATILPNVAALNSVFNQSWWNDTVYSTSDSPVGGFNQVTEIKSRIAAQFGSIRMAAHLTAPAKLRINSTESAEFPAGAAYFEIPQVLGTPTFAIIRNGQPVMTANGPQAITNSVWPGAWNPLITELQ